MGFQKSYITWHMLLCMSVCMGLEVRVGGGAVKAVMQKSRSGREYYAFKAIPYAHPPTGDKRFMPPMPGVKWDGVVDSTRESQPCAQAAMGVRLGVEDCLNLYVYTPKVEGNTSLPVVVWLHGGSFVLGSAAALNPSYLMDQDIVLVIPQYRLGFLGFFTTSTGHSTGNMGMLDQVLALEWVRDNIGMLGGDPNQVTLAGDCAGGAAAIYHMLSPLSQGLFHRVLSLSGSPLNPWAMTVRHHRFVLILANYIKCPAYDQAVLVQCLQEVQLEELLEALQNLVEARDPMVGNAHLSLSVQEAAHAHVSTLFLHQHPLKALASGDFTKVPVLLGVTRDVGAYLVDMMLYEFIQYKLEGEADFLDKLMAMLIKESGIQDPAAREEEITKFYFPGMQKFDNLDAMLPGLSQMLGDLQYNAGILAQATLLSEHVPTRLLRFDYEDAPKLFGLRYPDPTIAPPMPPQAVGHGDEMSLLLPDTTFNLNQAQMTASQTFVDMIVNFAYGRKPKEDWPLYNTQDHSTLVWGPESTSFISQPFASSDRMEMLQQLHQYQHKNTLEELREEAMATSHDEL